MESQTLNKIYIVTSQYPSPDYKRAHCLFEIEGVYSTKEVAETKARKVKIRLIWDYKEDMEDDEFDAFIKNKTNKQLDDLLLEFTEFLMSDSYMKNSVKVKILELTVPFN